MKKSIPITPTMRPPAGTPPVLSWVEVETLNIDDAYQRSLESKTSINLVRRIAAKWDWRLCQPVQVARRADDSLWIVDGQHRHAAAVLRGDIPKLPCVISEFGDLADEAAAFVRINKERRALGAVEVFKANLAAGQSEAIEVDALIREAGFTIAPHQNYVSWKPGMLYCVPGIASALRRFGKRVASAGLVAFGEAYEGQVLYYAGQMLQAVFRFYDANLAEIDFDPDLFIERLALNTQDQWMRRAAERVAATGEPKIQALTNVIAHAYRTAKAAA